MVSFPGRRAKCPLGDPIVPFRVFRLFRVLQETKELDYPVKQGNDKDEDRSRIFQLLIGGA